MEVQVFTKITLPLHLRGLLVTEGPSFVLHSWPGITQTDDEALQEGGR